MGLVLIKFLLPAITSSAYVAPAVFALKKNLRKEAFVFKFTAFFQLFHHLCTTPALSLLFCLLGEELLEFFAAYGELISTLMTIMLITHLSDQRKDFFITSIGFLGAVRIYNSPDKPNSFYGPLSVAGVILVITWAQEMHRKKTWYPKKERWGTEVLPAIVLFALAMSVRFYFENRWNFSFTHSLYHLLLSGSLVLLIRLADDRPKAEDSFTLCSKSNKGLSCCCCCCLPV